MEKSYSFKKKINKTYLMIFIIIFGSFFVFGLSETLRSSKALKVYQNNPSVSVDENSYESWDPVENDLENEYQFNFTITTILVLSSFIVFFAIFYSKNKMQIDQKGLSILGITGKDYTESYQWENIDCIEIGYSQGLASIFFEKALIIHQSSKSSTSIPIERFIKGDQIVEIIRANQLVDQIIEREVFETNDNNVFDFFRDTIKHLKNNLMIYLALSSIILVFTSLNILFNDSPINLITAIATFYFGIKANIAVNIFSFESFKNNYLSFNEIWEKTKGKFGRYWSSVFIQGLFQIPFILIALYIYNASSNIYFKGTMYLLVGLLYSASILWLFLLPYIASITTSKKSYFSLNASFLKGAYKNIIPLVLFELLRVTIFIVFFIRVDFVTLINMMDQFMLINSVIDFIKIPLFSAYIMRIIHKASFLETGEDNEIKEVI